MGLFGIAVFVLGLLALHLAAFRQPPPQMSQFANSRFGLFWLLAVYSLILGASMLVWALKPCLRDCRSKRVGLLMLWLAWFGAVLLAAFPTDAFRPVTLHGAIHENAALTTFVLLGAAMVVLAPAFRASPSLARFAGVSFVLGLLVTVSWIAYLAATLRDVAWQGPAQRILVALIVAWFTLLALRLLKAGGLEPGRQGRRAGKASRRWRGTAAMHSPEEKPQAVRPVPRPSAGAMRRKPAGAPA